MDYTVREIPKEDTRPWTEIKHYAKRFPKIYFSFGLFKDDVLLGVCTFGPCSRMLNNGYGLFNGKIQVRTIELNRLVVEDNLPKNTLSFFVARCLELLPQPMCVISYADHNYGHHGYIYQATNWMYLGTTQKEAIYRDKNTGKRVHQRQISYSLGTRVPGEMPEHIEVSKESYGKHRYLIFLGNKTQKKEMLRHLMYLMQPYPKGENTRYDSSGVIPRNSQLPL